MDFLSELCTMRAVSGYEYRISNKICDLFRPYCDAVFCDTLGNVIAVKRAKKANAKSVMIEAHQDEIGLMVSKIDESGLLHFVTVGGIDARILPGAEVVVHAKKDYLGVIGAKPPHLQDSQDADKCTKIKDMTIDIGLDEKTAKEQVSVGDTVTFAGGMKELLSDNVASKSLDDRASVYAILQVFIDLAKTDLSVDLYGVCAVCEEVGGRGAKTAGFGINPDIAIAIDVTHGITPDNSDNAFEMGSGVAISKGPNIHPALCDKLIERAKMNNIEHTVEIEGGDTGTDAWLLQVAGEGIPTALLSIPLRYMHTTVEVVSKKDINATVELAKAFVRDDCNNAEDWLCI